MVGGQMLDLEAEQKGRHDLDGIIAIQQLKTGALFRFSLIAGPILAGEDGPFAPPLPPMPAMSASPSRSPTTCSM